MQLCVISVCAFSLPGICSLSHIVTVEVFAVDRSCRTGDARIMHTAIASQHKTGELNVYVESERWFEHIQDVSFRHTSRLPCSHPIMKDLHVGSTAESWCHPDTVHVGAIYSKMQTTASGRLVGLVASAPRAFLVPVMPPQARRQLPQRRKDLNRQSEVLIRCPRLRHLRQRALEVRWGPLRPPTGLIQLHAGCQLLLYTGGV